MHEGNHSVFLKKGHYLAPKYQTANFDDLLVGVTKYKSPTATGVWHSHEKPMISFVLYGSNTEYRKGKITERTAGSVNYYHAYEQHKNEYRQFPSKHISLELDAAFLTKYHYTEEHIEFAVKNSQEAAFTFLKLMNEALADDIQSPHSVEMLFIDFIENRSISHEDTPLPLWMKTVRDVLNDRWNETISLNELAHHVAVHPTTISKYFRRYFRCTLGEYTRKLKVKRSFEIMRNANYSLTETAFMCGFSDQSHFTRTFKAMTGCLPKDYLKF